MPAAPLEIEIQLRWGDMDPLNHINNVQFARLLEEARLRATHTWFHDHDEDFPFLVARQEIEFVTPLLYDVAPATVQIWISRLGGASFDFACRLKTPQGDLSALAETTCTSIDPATGRPTPIPDSVREILHRHLGDEVAFRRRR